MKKEYFVVVKGFNHEVRKWVTASSKEEAERKVRKEYGISIEVRK